MYSTKSALPRCARKYDADGPGAELMHRGMKTARGRQNLLQYCTYLHLIIPAFTSSVGSFTYAIP